ncbi:MAG: hypothetical protein ABIE94_06760 [archaeon]
MTKTLATLAAVTILAATASSALADTNIGFIQSLEGGKDYAKVSAPYPLPGGINGFSFLELYENHGGFFGKTVLDRPVAGGVGPRVRGIHANEPLSSLGIGVSTQVPLLPDNISATVAYLPVWFNEDGVLEDVSLAEYLITAELPWGINLKSFGDWKLGVEDAPQWGYGEIIVSIDFEPFTLSYAPALRNDGDAIPTIEHRVGISMLLPKFGD